jgi:hypothetical protein
MRTPERRQSRTQPIPIEFLALAIEKVLARDEIGMMHRGRDLSPIAAADHIGMPRVPPNQLRASTSIGQEDEKMPLTLFGLVRKVSGAHQCWLAMLSALVFAACQPWMAIVGCFGCLAQAGQ